MQHRFSTSTLCVVSILIIATIAISSSGGSSNRATTQTTANDSDDSTDNVGYMPGTRRMDIDMDISSLRTYEDYVAFVDGYWNDFDFDAGEDVIAYDTANICQAFADYVIIIEPQKADSLLRSLMHRAERSRPVLDFFATVSNIVLYDPNSPLRNDEYYIPILEVLVESPLMDEYDRIAPAYDLQMASLNRIGTIANDFSYTLADGTTHRMHDIEADFLLIMLNNPGCPMCREITDAITGSPMLNELMELDRLKILAIYPDTDIEAWRAYQQEMPTGWISGYDRDQQLSQQQLYKLNAIPALYLLDAKKRVLIKDGSDVRQVEFIVSESDLMY